VRESWRARVLGRLRGYPGRKWLVRHGLRIGEGVYIGERVSFDHGFPWLISIGDHATITAGTRILAHDASTKRPTGHTRLGRVDIGEGVFIGAHAVVLPGVRIGDHAIVGAGSVVRGDVAAGAVVVGNPAVQVATVDEFAAKHEARMQQRPCYPRAGYSSYDGVTPQNMARMRAELADGCGYVG
jgi:maltose O-acetyltransferase